MNPTPGPTPEQEAVELEAEAQIYDAHGNHLFAKTLRERAGELHAGANGHDATSRPAAD